jgi:putative ABC transport system ATP-binding protein
VQTKPIDSITLKQVVPVFLADRASLHSGVWNSAELVLERGKHFMVKAPSGMGKSTLLGILFGSRKMHSGSLLFNNEPTAGWGNEEWSQVRQSQLSMLFQELRLFDSLTVRENLEFKQSLNKRVTLQTAEERLTELGLPNVMQRKAHTLSYGQQQRVALVRALMQPFSWLLLDEPFSHIDAENQKTCEALIERVCLEQGAGIVATSLGNDYQLHIHQTLTL